jgi:hypothetical protein
MGGVDADDTGAAFFSEGIAVKKIQEEIFMSSFSCFYSNQMKRLYPTKFLVFSSNTHIHTAVNEKEASRINFHILMEAYTPLEPEHEGFILSLYSNEERTYTNTLRNHETLKEKEFEILKNDCKKLLNIFSKTLKEKSDEIFNPQEALIKSNLICEILDFFSSSLSP